MKRLLWIAVLVFGVGCVGSGAQADGWGVCGGCHNGSMAPNKEELLAKYTNVDALIKGAQASDSPMMGQIKKNIDGLKAAATAIGLKAE
jgi:hypothetical protein